MCSARWKGGPGYVRRGRPREFDPEAVLDRATRLFWARGFNATSVADVGAETGLSPPSLYAAWPNKEALFCECLSRYARTDGARSIDALTRAATLDAGLTAYFDGMLHSVDGSGAPPGCFMVATLAEMTALPPKARERAAQLRVAAEAIVEGAVRAACGRGELQPGLNLRAFAGLIISAGLALALKARAGTPASTLRREARAARAILLAVAAGQVTLPRR